MCYLLNDLGGDILALLPLDRSALGLVGESLLVVVVGVVVVMLTRLVAEEEGLLELGIGEVLVGCEAEDEREVVGVLRDLDLHALQVLEHLGVLLVAPLGVEALLDGLAVHHRLAPEVIDGLRVLQRLLLELALRVREVRVHLVQLLRGRDACARDDLALLLVQRQRLQVVLLLQRADLALQLQVQALLLLRVVV